MWTLAEDKAKCWGSHDWINFSDPEKVRGPKLENGIGGKWGGAGLCSKGGDMVWRLEGPPWTAMEFVPCTEHLKKGTDGG